MRRITLAPAPLRLCLGCGPEAAAATRPKIAPTATVYQIQIVSWGSTPIVSHFASVLIAGKPGGATS